MLSSSVGLVTPRGTVAVRAPSASLSVSKQERLDALRNERLRIMQAQASLMARPRSVARSNAGSPAILQTDEIEKMKEELKQARINEELMRDKNAQLVSKEKVFASEKHKLEQEIQVLKLEKFKSEQVAGEVDALRHQLREADNWKNDKDKMVKELDELRKEKESLRQQLKSEKSQRLVLAASLEQVQKELNDATGNNRSCILSSVPSVPERRPTMLDSETIQIFSHEEVEEVYTDTPAVAVTRTTSFIDVEQRGSARKNSLEEMEEKEEEKGKVQDEIISNLWGQNDPFPAEENEDAKLFSTARLFQDQPFAQQNLLQVEDFHFQPQHAASHGNSHNTQYGQQHAPHKQQHSSHDQEHASHVQQHSPHVQQHSPQVQQHSSQVQQHSPHLQQHSPNFQQQLPPQIQQHNVPHVQQQHAPHFQQHPAHVQQHPPVQKHTPHIQQHPSHVQQQHAPHIQQQNTPQMAPQGQQPPHLQYQTTSYPQQTPQQQSPFPASGVPVNNARLPSQQQQAHSWNQTPPESNVFGQPPSQTSSSQSSPPVHSLLRNNLPSRSSVPAPSQPSQNINPAPPQPMHPAFGAGRSQSGRSSPFPQQAPMPQNLPQQSQNGNQIPFSQPQPPVQHHQQYQQNYQFPAQQHAAQPHHTPQLAQSARLAPSPSTSGMYPSGQQRY